jgi:hypothetical protein
MKSEMPYCDIETFKEKSKISNEYEFKKALKMLHSWGDQSKF